jgi:RNA 3'-phosphate cyclase
MKQLGNATVTGLEIGSPSLTFSPEVIQGRNYRFDIGTAGSITLVFQACILASLQTKNKITITIAGGTDVKWSPSWDYFNHVFLPLLQKMGIPVTGSLIKRGYYPKGGGEAQITIEPCQGVTPLQLDTRHEATEIQGVIHSANLPDHIGTRMKHAVIQTFFKKKLTPSIQIEKTTAFSTGTGITLWSQSKNSILGHTALGEKGVPSEKIGEDAANGLLREIAMGSTLDPYACDQLLPYMAIAAETGPSTCLVREVSGHAHTNMWLIKQFFDVQFDITKINDVVKILVTRHR